MRTSDPKTRRAFLTATAATATATLLPRNLLSQQESQLANDPERPQFHLLPARNWMNDPNGPIYFNGRYHMFFQYNPLAAVWGDMSWNHAVSPDMLHWTHLPVAFTPTPGSPDAFGCFSGSALQLGKRVYAVYTGTVKSTPDKATIHADGIQESQCLAWSDDPRLVTWQKDPEPIIPLPPFPVTGFRDPFVWKQADAYYMTVGSGVAKTGGCVLLYRSDDLHTWQYLHNLTEGPWTPPASGEPTPNPCDDGEMWECPDFFPLPGSPLATHCLIYSTIGKVYWQSGTLDLATMLFHPLKTGLLDLDAFYAPKTQLDAHGNRILWGWIPERRPDAAMRTAGWSGMMSLPRVLTLTPDGRLHQQFLPATTTPAPALSQSRNPEPASGTQSPKPPANSMPPPSSNCPSPPPTQPSSSSPTIPTLTPSTPVTTKSLSNPTTTPPSTASSTAPSSSSSSPTASATQNASTTPKNPPPISYSWPQAARKHTSKPGPSTPSPPTATPPPPRAESGNHRQSTHNSRLIDH
jgi:beta-fructofuranosidase